MDERYFMGFELKMSLKGIFYIANASFPAKKISKTSIAGSLWLESTGHQWFSFTKGM